MAVRLPFTCRCDVSTLCAPRVPRDNFAPSGLWITPVVTDALAAVRDLFRRHRFESMRLTPPRQAARVSVAPLHLCITPLSTVSALPTWTLVLTTFVLTIDSAVIDPEADTHPAVTKLDALMHPAVTPSVACRRAVESVCFCMQRLELSVAV